MVKKMKISKNGDNITQNGEDVNGPSEMMMKDEEECHYSVFVDFWEI
jgi:hypothetical protein